jgi:hypothetical protein
MGYDLQRDLKNVARDPKMSSDLKHGMQMMQ